MFFFQNSHDTNAASIPMNLNKTTCGLQSSLWIQTESKLIRTKLENILLKFRKVVQFFICKNCLQLYFWGLHWVIMKSVECCDNYFECGLSIVDPTFICSTMLCFLIKLYHICNIILILRIYEKWNRLTLQIHFSCFLVCLENFTVRIQCCGFLLHPVKLEIAYNHN